MTRGSHDRSWSSMGEISWPQSQLRAGDLLWMWSASLIFLVLCHQDLVVIHGVMMTGGRVMAELVI